MSYSYVDTIRKPPSTLTVDEQTALLRVTGEHKDGFRDHVLFSVALGTALREHEIAALTVGDILMSWAEAAWVTALTAAAAEVA